MWFVTRVDDWPPHHRVQIDEAFEKVGALGDLVLGRTGLVLRPDLSRAGKNLSRYEERRQDFDQTVEWHRSRDEIILMIPVTVALPVRVVLVDDALFAPPCTRQAIEALGEDALPVPFECHDFPRVGAFRTRVFGMG